MSRGPRGLLEPEARVASTDQLRAVLASTLRRNQSRARIVHIERAPGAYGSSWWLEDLTVHLDDGGRLTLVFKDLCREASGSGARTIKPAFVTNPTREAWVYRRLLHGIRTGAPKLWASVTDPTTGRNWLFLERVRGVPLAQVGDRRAWCCVARWLGRFHATAPIPRSAGCPLLRHDREYHRGWMARARSAAEEEARNGPTGRDGAREKLARLRAIAPAHERSLAEALAAGDTLIHGEFYPSNVMVDRRGTTYAIHPVDWESAALGPPLLDLAALLSGHWRPEERDAMEKAYRDGAQVVGARCSRPDEFRRRLAACRLLLAVQWQGWARAWDPPADHRNDWLEEAERCAEELLG
jgi:aminoglycoside phosphotransferase (APT) family kinase protein